MSPRPPQDLDSAIQQYNQDLHDARSSRFPNVPKIRIGNAPEPKPVVEQDLLEAKVIPQPSRQEPIPVNTSLRVDEQSQMPLNAAHERLLGSFSTLRMELTEVLSNLEQQCRLRFEQFSRLKEAIESNRKGLEALYQVELPPDNIDALLDLQKQKRFQLKQELEQVRQRAELEINNAKKAFNEELRLKRMAWEEEQRQYEQKRRLAGNNLAQLKKEIEDEKKRIISLKEDELKQLESVYRQKVEKLRDKLEVDESDLKDMVNRRRQDWMEEEAEYDARRKSREEEEQHFLANLALNRKLDQDLYESRRSALEQEMEDLKAELEVELKERLDLMDQKEALLADRERQCLKLETENESLKEQLAEHDAFAEQKLEEALSINQTTLSNAHQQAMADLKKAHAEALQEQKQAFADETTSLKTGQQQHLAEQLAEKDNAYGALKKEQESLIALLKEEYESHIARLKTEHTDLLSSVKKDHDLALLSLKEVQNSTLESLKLDHSKDMQRLKEANEETVISFEKRLEETESIAERRQLQLETRVLDLDEECRLLQEKLDSVMQKNQELMESAAKRYVAKETSGSKSASRPKGGGPKILRSKLR